MKARYRTKRAAPIIVAQALNKPLDPLEKYVKWAPFGIDLLCVVLLQKS